MNIEQLMTIDVFSNDPPCLHAAIFQETEDSTATLGGQVGRGQAEGRAAPEPQAEQAIQGEREQRVHQGELEPPARGDLPASMVSLRPMARRAGLVAREQQASEACIFD